MRPLPLGSILWLWLSFWAAASAAEEARILAMDVVRDGGNMQLTIPIDRELGYEAFLLDTPKRLVIDFKSGRFDAAFALPDGDPARYGYFQLNRPRIVLDLDRPLGIDAAFIGEAAGKLTLMIDLKPISEAVFATEAGWPEGAEWVPQPRRPFSADGRLVIAVDPGHGGIDPGASVDGLIEKEIALRIGKVVAQKIDATPGFKAVLTREEDVYVPLRQRLRIAAEVKANVLVSLHADSLEKGGAKGVSVYTLSTEGKDQAAEAYAERENRADVLAGADLVGETDQVARLLLELSHRATAPESDRLASMLLTEFGKDFDLLRTRPHRKAAFVVLKSPDLPSVLIELGFLSSEEDRKRLQSDAYAEAIADALVAGLKAWAEAADPAFTAPRN